VVCSTLSVAVCFVQAPQYPAASLLAAEESLKQFLQTLDHGKTTRYVAALYDLDGDGTPEAIVYLVSSQRCGSGGCNTLIMARDGSSWTIVTAITITRPPIRVLTNTSNGWRDIGVWVQGGGIQPGYEAELHFNGKTYPTNPTIPPAQRLDGRAVGSVVIPSSQDARLLNP
jgi:hypothetical protein